MIFRSCSLTQDFRLNAFAQHLWRCSFGATLLAQGFWRMTFGPELLAQDLWTRTFAPGPLEQDLRTRTFGPGLWAQDIQPRIFSPGLLTEDFWPCAFRPEGFIQDITLGPRFTFGWRVLSQDLCPRDTVLFYQGTRPNKIVPRSFAQGKRLSPGSLANKKIKIFHQLPIFASATQHKAVVFLINC